MKDSEASLDRLIAAAKRHDHAPAAETERAWASLEAAMIGGVAPSVPIDLGTTASAAGGGIGLKALVVVGVTVITAVTTVVVASAIDSRDGEVIVRVEGAPELRASTRSGADVPAPATLPAVPAPSVAAAPVVTTVPEAPSSSRRAAPSEPVSSAEPPPAASTLAEEARLLGDAWRELNAGDNAAALAGLREHARRFPNSPLAREREAARIVAWCAERKPWATAQADRFLADHAGGALAERVERACKKE